MTALYIFKNLICMDSNSYLNRIVMIEFVQSSQCEKLLENEAFHGPPEKLHTASCKKAVISHCQDKMRELESVEVAATDVGSSFVHLDVSLSVYWLHDRLWRD